MEEVLEIIKAIIDLQKNYVKSWRADNAGNQTFNLRRKNLSSLLLVDEHKMKILDSVFLSQLLAERDDLSKKIVTMTLPYDSLLLESRVKTEISLLDKLERYMFSNSEKGQVKVVKCINDLVGFRKILPHDVYVSLYDMMNTGGSSVFNELDPNVSIRCLPGGSKKSSYKAVHVYIQCESYIFPWEIQFWDIQNEKNNRNSHEQYKQSYLKKIDELKGEVND